ncbi:hypothetical protein GQ56_0138385 [Burkholderia paludis]|nr:hypothetical protein GQ56_0138385 [Burkholderia paludis]
MSSAWLTGVIVHAKAVITIRDAALKFIGLILQFLSLIVNPINQMRCDLIVRFLELLVVSARHSLDSEVRFLSVASR